MTAQTSLVVGLGNPLQGCDGFGAAVLERLRDDQRLRPETQLLDGATDLLAYVDRFAAFDLVVLVDAILGPAPRELVVLPEDAFDAWPLHATSAHQVSPLVTLRLFHTLEPRSKTRFVLVGLRVPEEAFSADVSVADAQAGAEAVLRALSGECPEPR